MKKIKNTSLESSIRNARNYTVPNQNIIIRQPSEKEEPYHVITEKEYITACNLLSGKALAVWGLYALQKEDYTMLSGAKQIKNKGIDISQSSYMRVINTLKDNGYITEDPNNKDILRFWTLPHKEEYKPEEEKDNYQAQFLTLHLPEEKTNKFNHITAFGKIPQQYTFDHDEGELPF